MKIYLKSERLPDMVYTIWQKIGKQSIHFLLFLILHRIVSVNIFDKVYYLIAK